MQRYHYEGPKMAGVHLIWASLMAQIVNNLQVMKETQVQSLSWNDPLEKEMEIHSSTPDWRIPSVQYMGSQRVRHDWVTNTHTHTWFSAGLFSHLKCRSNDQERLFAHPLPYMNRRISLLRWTSCHNNTTTQVGNGKRTYA